MRFPFSYLIISLGFHLVLLFTISFHKKEKLIKEPDPFQEVFKISFKHAPKVKAIHEMEKVEVAKINPIPIPRIIPQKKSVKKQLKKDIVKKRMSARKKIKAPILTKKRTYRKATNKVSAKKMKIIKATYMQQLKKYLEKNKKYPRLAMRLRQKGIVTVKLTISKNGKFSNIRLVGPSKFRSLNTATLSYLKNLGRFKPLPTKYLQGEDFVIPISYKL